MNNGGQIIDILLAGHYVSQEDVERAKQAAEAGTISVLDFLLSENIISKDLIGQAIAEHYRVGYADLNTYVPSKDRVLQIPLVIAKKYRVILFDVTKNGVTIATDNPTQKDLLAEVKKVLKAKKIKVAYSLPEDIDEVLLMYKKPLHDRIQNIIETHEKVTPDIVREILDEAISTRASDVHFEPQDKNVQIRFRIDGVMKKMTLLTHEQYRNVVNRIKVMARLRTDQHLSAQDGAIRYKAKKETVDIRVSIVPIFDGEKIVMRMLSAYAKSFALGDLGMGKDDQEIIEEESKKPFGMILVSGPTGSGKTTTLYGVLKLLNKPEVNIATIEDPVEYKIGGVNHIQVNTQTELTFARGLRSIVRQDPDIILVGEIRDEETAEIAVNAALTGHLLLSTFHANDAATSVPRLLDMGIEPFLLSSTLQSIVSQRLVRKICDHCRYSEVLTKKQITDISPAASEFFGTKATFYKGKGCVSCAHTGYKGRTGVFEFIKVTQEMQELIMTRPTTQEIAALARSQGARSMYEDGIEKVQEGLTTIQELERVVAPPTKRYGIAQGKKEVPAKKVARKKASGTTRGKKSKKKT